MKFDYNLELNNILNKIYQHKICQIALKNNFSDINDENKNYCLDILKNTKIYLGNDMDDFIKSLIPKDKEGYFFRSEVAKHHNYSYPRIFDYAGNKLKNITVTKLAYQLWESHMDEMLIDFRSEVAKHHNYSYPRIFDYAGNKLKNITVTKLAYQLWESHMDEMLIEDIRRRFSQSKFILFLDNNFNNIINDINLYLKKSNESKSITIPFKKGDDLVQIVKSMILNNELDFTWAQMLIDMDKMRDDMVKWSIAFHMYNEFDKLEDELEDCLNKFFKYDSSSLYEFLINEKKFKYIDGIGLVHN